MVKDITELYGFLRKGLESEIEVIELDNKAGIMEGNINKDLFTILFNPSLGLKFITTDNMSYDLFDAIRRLLLKATGNFKTHVSYNKQVDDAWVSVIEWNFVDPDELMYKYDCMGNSLKGVKNISCYSGGLQVSYSILAYKDRVFVPLPKKQQLTEETLIALERRIIKAAQKNEEMLEKSYYKAEHMMPCMNDGEENKGISYTKKR